MYLALEYHEIRILAIWDTGIFNPAFINGGVQRDRIRDLKGTFAPWAGSLNTTGIVRTGESVSNNRASSGSSAVATVEIDASLAVLTGPDVAGTNQSKRLWRRVS
jgi:hypothetical protein